MAIAQLPSMRTERAEISRLAWALTISLAAHLLLFEGYQTGQKYGWWQNLHWPTWLEPAKLLPSLFKKKEDLPLAQRIQAQLQPREVPLMFVEVNPAVATPEPPPNAKYYAALNSRAANPEADKDTDTPKISGKRPEIVRTEDVPRTKSFPLQPAAPPPEKTQEAQEELKPKPAYTPGDLALAKPDPKPRTDEGSAEQERPKRPRTLAEARARQPQQPYNRLVGEKMKQDGGVRRRNVIASLDARGTLFGAYDQAIVDAVQNRWYDLLESRGWAADRTGKVMLRFHLNADGTVSEMAFIANTVDLALGMLCQSAITDSAPFPPWPSDMRREVGANFREVTFTFYYY